MQHVQPQLKLSGPGGAFKRRRTPDEGACRLHLHAAHEAAAALQVDCREPRVAERAAEGEQLARLGAGRVGARVDVQRVQPRRGIDGVEPERCHPGRHLQHALRRREACQRQIFRRRPRTVRLRGNSSATMWHKPMANYCTCVCPTTQCALSLVELHAPALAPMWLICQRIQHLCTCCAATQLRRGAHSHLTVILCATVHYTPSDDNRAHCLDVPEMHHAACRIRPQRCTRSKQRRASSRNGHNKHTVMDRTALGTTKSTSSPFLPLCGASVVRSR